MIAVKAQEKADARPFDIMLPGPKMTRVWLNEDGSPKMFEVKEPLYRNILRVELASDGSVAKVVDLSGCSTPAAELAAEFSRQLNEVLKGFDADTIRRTRERGKAWSW